MILLALLLQAGLPTVGDTIWVSRTIEVPPGHTVRPGEWEPADSIELLGPARVTLRGSEAVIAYPVVIWRPGAYNLAPPGPLLLGADGSVDSLAPKPVELLVASVLPRVPPDSTLRPQPRAEFVPRAATTPIPVILLGIVAVLLLAPLHWWWRRRGLAAGGIPRHDVDEPMSEVLERWADAGEFRAVAAAAAARVRAAIGRSLPAAHPALDTEAVLSHLSDARTDWPLAEIGDLLRSLDEARFGRTTFPDAIGLARWAAELEPKLEREAA
jgi:hypothetical protein